MSEILQIALTTVAQSKSAWCRFITANDTGATGSHQSGFYVPKTAAGLFFDTPCIKGENKERQINITWQNSFTTDSCIKYYGQGTRNEYRLTRFGRGFPFLSDDNVGDLLIIARLTEDEYAGFVLTHDQDIDSFFAYFNISPGETNLQIDIQQFPEWRLETAISGFAATCDGFPSTRVMSEVARNCYNSSYSISDDFITQNPDETLLNWIDAEYHLFRQIEERAYAHLLNNAFKSVDELIKSSNEILNRRKARAGKSLEHHLAYIFTSSSLIFEEQGVTEDNKRPDFLFPDSESYRNLSFPTDGLVVLGAKTTCKDRWRQVLSEADRLDEKYLFTLQQGISKNQLKEMKDSNLRLVVPRIYIGSFPAEYRHDLLPLSAFINLVKSKQEHLPRHFLP